jgi:hypothetical protein
MSEYQYYEFQAIDRPLTEEEQRAVAQLSSRVHPHPRRAVFTYSWSDFPGRGEEVLARYYDAMLYLANWGSRRLMFRFPKSLVDPESLQGYNVGTVDYPSDFVSAYTKGEYAILDIQLDEEEGLDWIEGEGWLDSLLELRDAVLRQDYRLLYLAWLKGLELAYDVDEDALEPPVPSGLKKLSPALRNFVELFEVDEDSIEVAAEGSGKPKTTSEDDLRRAIAVLSDKERDTFLLRLARGEPNLSAAFGRQLAALIDVPGHDAGPGRTVGQLLAAAQEETERARKQRAAEAEAKRIAELEALSAREAHAWREVDALIQEAKAKPYDRAVELLSQLKELAAYRDQEAAFQERLNQIYDQYARRTALLRRLCDAGLTEG